MLNLHPSLEVVYAVVAAIPVLGARPGDEIILRPSDPDFPIEVRRTFPIEMLAAIPDAAVRMLGAASAFAAPASGARDRPVLPLRRAASLRVG